MFKSIVCKIVAILSRRQFVNTLRPTQNDWYFAHDIGKCIFFNEDIWIWIQVSLKFVPMSPINSIPALDLSLDQIMDWRRPGDKPLSEPVLVRLSTHCHAYI